MARFSILPRGNASTHSCFIVLSLMLKPIIPYTQIWRRKEKGTVKVNDFEK
jgi:hypothetical protein